MGLYIVLYYVKLFALDHNITPEISEYLLIIINLSALPGRLIPGYFADRIGSINVQFSVALLSMILTFCLMTIRSAVSLVVFAILFGFSTGAFMGLPAAGVVNLSADKSKIGTRLGITLAFVGIGVLVDNPIAGTILGANKNWVGLTSWCGTLLAASSVSMAACRISKE
ncbi:unnamed protein product [Clonostachys rhizophaga]|uniref:Major facilitator superfamily (MFS) profile domain-containing protein n=1 Tax=Clonostachys rhizophaga TaxID=160324 RepID=A0A9N9VS66_9HYPO|nr:unnamed protein product [Clonostachys rhizophaga]